MQKINHLISLSVKDLAYTSSFIGHDLHVFEAIFLENPPKNTIGFQWVSRQVSTRRLLGKLIISAVLSALACASYAVH